MRDLRRLTAIQVSKAYYRDSFSCFLQSQTLVMYAHAKERPEEKANSSKCDNEMAGY
jgi:hypothetical protein